MQEWPCKTRCYDIKAVMGGFACMFVARFDFLSHTHSPDLSGRRIYFEVKGHPGVKVTTEEIVVSSQFLCVLK